MKNKVDIWIDGYNEDKRELYEIDEVKTWILEFLEKIKGWSYFLSTKDGMSFLKLSFLCHIEIDKIVKSGISEYRIDQGRVEFDIKSGKLFFDKFFNDLNSFTDKQGISDEENLEICEKMFKELTGNEIKL